MKPIEPIPVKLVCGFLYSDETLYAQAVNQLTEKFGHMDYTSKPVDFDITTYYVPEMGIPIKRVISSFTDLINPGELASIKLFCNGIEDDLADAGMRKVNLDPGYLDYDKLVLASAKYQAHKIYLDKGIYADPTLKYEKGRFIAGDYAFPDFKTGIYSKDFLNIRTLYKKQQK